MTIHRELPVSVVIPAYRCAEYIVACVDSVLAATPSPHEVIVVDDGSPDDTGERLAPFVSANRIRYVRQQNAGVAAARNAGAGLATSEYLFFLDADDLVFPEALPPLVDQMDTHPDVALAYGEIVVFSSEPPEPPLLEFTARPVSRTTFLRFNPVGTPGQVIVRRSAFEQVGGFRSDFWGTEDWDLWLRLVERSPAMWVRVPVLAYRTHGNNMSGNVARMYRSSLNVARAHVRRLPRTERVIMRAATYRALRAYHTRRLEKMIVARLGEGDWKLASAAARAWIIAWSTDVSATARLKAHLAARGRWRLAVEEQPA